MRFWIRRRSSGSVTSVQSSVLIDLDLDFDLEDVCLLLLWLLEPDCCLDDGLEDILPCVWVTEPESSTLPAGTTCTSGDHVRVGKDGPKYGYWLVLVLSDRLPPDLPLLLPESSHRLMGLCWPSDCLAQGIRTSVEGIKAHESIMCSFRGTAIKAALEARTGKF